VPKAATPVTQAASRAAPAPGDVPFRARNGKVLSPSLRRTFELYREGLDIPEIAGQRGLSTATITTHLADLILAGGVDDISRWVDDVTLARIRRAAGPGPIGALAPLREALGEGISYEQLHLARAYLTATAR
jgi:ATP-dependent DNA helicase RecQ